VGKQAPQRVQHMQSSCPRAGACSWFTAFYPGRPNPQLELAEGALVAGPGAADQFVDDRTSNSSAVGVHYNAPFVAALAGLLDSGASSKSCGQLRGVFQDAFDRGDV
jgi:hypothetical protein